MGSPQTLPALYSLPADFHDVTTGSNGYPAGPGYELATGLGTPQANLLVPALAAYGVITTPEPSTVVLLGAAAVSLLAYARRKRGLQCRNDLPKPTPATIEPSISIGSVEPPGDLLRVGVLF